MNYTCRFEEKRIRWTRKKVSLDVKKIYKKIKYLLDE